MLFPNFPILKTPRLVLRDLRPSDDLALFEVFKDEEVTRYYDTDVFTDITQAQELITFLNTRYEKGTGIRWAITRQGEDQLIGTIGFNSWNKASQVGVIGYELAKPYWNQGIISEALQAMLDFGFSTDTVNRVEALVMPGNIASVRVLRKYNFQLEGLLREKGYWKGAFHDLEMYALLKREYK